MANDDVAFLNAGRRCRWNSQADVAQIGHLASGLTGQPDDAHPLVTSRLDRPQNVATVTAGRQRKQHIAFPALRTHFAGEDFLVSVVVADRCERRGIAVEGHRAQRLAIPEEASGELGGDVLSVRCGAAVATHEERTTGGHRAGDEGDDPIDVARKRSEGRSDLQVLVPDRLDRRPVRHLSVHVRTPGSTNVRLTSWLPAFRSASCTAYRRNGSQMKNMNPPPPAPLIFPPSAPARITWS